MNMWTAPAPNRPFLFVSICMYCLISTPAHLTVQISNVRTSQLEGPSRGAERGSLVSLKSGS